MTASGRPPGDEIKSSTAAISTAGIPIVSSQDPSLGTLTAPTTRWVQQDLIETREILRVFWNERIIKYNKPAMDGFKKYLLREHFKNSPNGQEILDTIFKDAALDFEKFCSSIQQFPLRFIHELNAAENLVSHKETKEIAHRIEKNDIDELHAYMHEEKISGAVAMRGDTGDLIIPDMPENKSSYAMHSVGKVFTGMLVMRMIQEGIITESALKKPLDDDFIKTLPISIQNHLKENQITLHQLMTHQSGLGDYLPQYFKDIEAGKEPKINKPEEFLQFEDKRWFAVGGYSLELMYGRPDVAKMDPKKLYVGSEGEQGLFCYVLQGGEIERISLAYLNPDMAKSITETACDFIDFNDNQAKAIFDITAHAGYTADGIQYSNTGLVLVGLAIQAAYEKKYGPCAYDKILRRYIIDDANISCFFSKMPKGSRYNPEDQIAPHIAGGPAGGYWAKAEDLAKFGKWIYERCMADEKDTSDRPKLKRLIESYGQEFYYPQYNCVAHGGAIPTSSAFLRVSLETGSVIACLSDQPRVALHLQGKIRENMFSSLVTPVLTHTPPNPRV